MAIIYILREPWNSPTFVQFCYLINIKSGAIGAFAAVVLVMNDVIFWKHPQGTTFSAMIMLKTQSKHTSVLIFFMHVLDYDMEFPAIGSGPANT